VINAMREDALGRIGLDIKMTKLEVCSYLDKPSDQDDDLQFQKHETNENLLEMCDTLHQLHNCPPSFKRNFSEIQSTFLFGETLRVFQWNVLAQSLGKENDNFVRCCPSAFDWKIRRWKMLKELVIYDPDIICLQEVDHPKLLTKALQSAGYSGRFLHKPDSPCLYLPNNNGPDGCAIFFKSSKFDIICWTSRILKVWDVPSNQVVIAAILRCKQSGQELLVATTHFKAKFGELRASFRTEQSKDILKWLEAIRGGRPIILTGDLNGPPNEDFYSRLTGDKDVPLMSSYKLNTNDEENEDKDVINDDKVKSLEYTTWKIRDTGEQKHILDYILHTPGQIQTLRTLNVPDGNELGAGKLPSTRFVSDHMSLVADISLISHIN